MSMKRMAEREEVERLEARNEVLQERVDLVRELIRKRHAGALSDAMVVCLAEDVVEGRKGALDAVRSVRDSSC